MRNVQYQTSLPEQLLWRKLQPEEFRRRQPLGRYTVDFVCHPKKLVVEVAHHQRSRYGKSSTQALSTLGYQVVRFEDDDVRSDLSGVLQTIKIELAKRSWGQRAKRSLN